MTREEKSVLIDKLIDKVVRESDDTWGKNINAWDWNPGVCLMGIIKACQKDNNPKHIEMLKTWFNDNFERRAFGSVNNVAPTNVPLYLEDIDDDPRYSKVIDEYVDWCMNVALRTVNGGFGHVWYFPDGSEGHPDYKNQLWVDTLYMSVIFMVRYGLKYDRKDVLDEALKQAKVHLESLYDYDSDLVFHAYQCNDKYHMGQHWGRGNGWFVAVLAELLSMFKGTDYDMSEYEEAFVKTMNKAMQFVDDNKFIHTLVDDMTSYPEATATMLFGYAAAKGAEIGILGEEFAKWAQEATDAIVATIGDDLYIPNCSGGTNPGTAEEYKNIAISETMYANGLLIQLLTM